MHDLRKKPRIQVYTVWHHQPPKIHSANHTWKSTRIQQISPSGLQITPQLELQVPAICTDTSFPWWPTGCFPEAAMGHFNIKSGYEECLEWPVTINKMQVANLNPSDRATFSSKPCSNNPWKVNPTTLCPLLEVKRYHECLGKCYKVTYSITHNRKAKVWDIH